MRSLLLEFLRLNDLATGIWREGDPYLVAAGVEYPIRQFDSPLEHEKFRDLTRALRYQGDAEGRRAALKEIGEIAAGLIGSSSLKALSSGDYPLQLDLVVNPAEVAALPFEAATDGEGTPLSARTDPAVVITRRVRGAFAEASVRWPAKPRLLYAWAAPPGAGEVPAAAHEAALRKALGPWMPVEQGAGGGAARRDPYTTGHQMRVTDLACFIAKVMMVPPTQIEGIRVAGLLHDIGKIAIPTEILSKPGKLNDVEYEMIKTHSKVGYNILKKIEFPWPVARTVLQHHERWNGSGYLHGIRGEDILLEARILAVADVMEAMSSHRPYRPTVGADKALDEITRNSGILYDPAVAKACVTAFTEAGFKFAAAGPGGAGEIQSTSLSHTAEHPEDQ